MAHPKTLKDNIPHSQALHIKRICSKTSEVIKHVKGLKDICFYQWGYQSKILDYHLERAMSVDQKIRLENKEKLYLKTLKSRNNQDIVHHALQDWTIFVVNKLSRLKHSRQKKPFKYFTTFHENWKPNPFTPMLYMPTS